MTLTVCILVAVIAASVYDIYALVNVRPTVSRMILEFVQEYPIVVFAAGVLAGHLFWPLHK